MMYVTDVNNDCFAGFVQSWWHVVQTSNKNEIKGEHTVTLYSYFFFIFHHFFGLHVVSYQKKNSNE